MVIDGFADGRTNETLEYVDRLWDSSLVVEIPRGSIVTRAELVLEGVPRAVPGTRLLDFSDLAMGKHLWAREAYGTNIHPPWVDPYHNNWSPATQADLVSLASVDDDRWHTETDDDCQPPYEWPIQLYHLNPVLPGATSIEVMWCGMGYNMVNTTTNFHAQLWLFNHSSSRWDEVDSYVGGPSANHWFRHVISPPSPHLSTNGSIDVALVGMHSDEQNVGPVILTDQGHLYTEYVAVNATSTGGLQYPEDVTIAIGGHVIGPLTGPLTGEMVLGDGQGLRTALQSAIDDEVVSPGNLSLALNISVGTTTMGLLEVRGLAIEYEPPTNQPPEWRGPESVELLEDSPWTAVLDLEASFSDDLNQGQLTMEVVAVSDGANLSARVGVDPWGNLTLEVLPVGDFFGEVGVTVRAEDLFGEATPSPEVLVRVVQVPDPPRLVDPGGQEVDENAPWSLQVVVEDPDLPDDELAFSLSDGPEGMAIDGSTGLLSWTPGDDQVGEHTINVSVSDRFDHDDGLTIPVTVRGINDAPVITSPLEVEAVQDAPVNYRITARDPDLPFGDQLVYDAASEDAELTVVRDTGQVYFVPANDNVPGFEVVLRVMDLRGGTDEAVLVVSVGNVNDPPDLLPAGPLEFKQGEEVSLRLEATDPDLGLELPVPERLTFAGMGPEALLPDGDGWINLTPGQSLSGEHEVTYTVTDLGGLSDTIVVSWTVVDVNDPPVITTTVEAVVYAFEDAGFTMTFEAADVDGDAIHWSDDSDLFDIDPATGSVAFIPLQADVGRTTVTVTASDGRGGRASLVLDLEVVGMNDPPVIRSVLPENGTRIREGEKVTLRADVTDEDDLDVTCVWMEGDRELGRGATLDLGGLSVGEHTITLVVTDGEHDVERTAVVFVEASGGMGSLTLAMLALVIALVVLGLFLARRRGQHSDGEGSGMQEE